ncbi:MAG: cytidine deaminase [Clostridiales Family XIII bacterium]|jgi:cytidine deaminase|nr:cytidine deaminase [Clostridiales Family XIII bacterium]
MTDVELYQLAEEAAGGAYAPYSGYLVGAALLTASGKVYTGANVENASYGAAICAERAAALKAVADGERAFLSMAVAAPGTNAPAWPCGICRQFLFEFGEGLRIVAGAGAGSLSVRTLAELLPHGFRLEKYEGY